MRRVNPAVVLSCLVLSTAAALPAGALAATSTPTATGTGGAVASMDLDASQAGIDVLRKGGNAIDAAVATASALGVTIPFVAGPEGGGFMVIYDARTHSVTTIDGRENCPAACTSSLFIDPSTGQPMDYTTASDQPLSTAVPGNLATWDKAVALYGRRSLAQDLQPAIRIAERGFRVNSDFVQLTQSGLQTLQAYPASRQLLLDPSGNPLAVGTLLKNPDLAKTYRLIAKDGAGAFYDGPIGQAIVQADDHPVLQPGQTIVTQPGIMTAVQRRLDRGRDPQHPERLQPRRRASCDRALPLPGGLATCLRRPQPLGRRPAPGERAAERSA